MKLIYFLAAVMTFVGCSSTPSRKTASLDQIVIPVKQRNALDCEAFQKKLPDDLKRGYITQLESDGRNTREIKIFYYGKWQRKPLVIANGGPGGSSWTTYRDLGPGLDREKIEYIFFDQKGTGCSSDYPELDEKNWSTWRNYSSRGLAADVELLRKELNLGQKISIFGHSFGAKIALRYAIDYPASTHSILFYGDSFVASEQDIIQAVATTLKKQQNFLNQRISIHPKLETTLKSLAQKFKSAPCAADEKNLISACGYDLIRDLGHYYTETSADRIEQLLYKLDDPQTADQTLREVVLKYTHWKLDPTSVLLGYMDYRNVINGQLVCDQGLKEVTIPDWALNSCSIAKSRKNFLQEISPFVEPQLVVSQDIFKVLKSHPTVKAYEFTSAGDLNSGDSAKMNAPSNWVKIELSGADHFNYLTSPLFWATVRKAL